MRILVLNADYPRFLAWLYRREDGLENASYAAQLAARNNSLFGVADFYSRNFAAEGHVAADLHVNNPWLQSAWAREHGIAVEPVDPPGHAAAKALPGWLQRVVTPFKPLLRPLARRVGLSPKLDAQAEKILLAQVEEFRPDLIIPTGRRKGRIQLRSRPVLKPSRLPVTIGLPLSARTQLDRNMEKTSRAKNAADLFER